MSLFLEIASYKGLIGPYRGQEGEKKSKPLIHLGTSYLHIFNKYLKVLLYLNKYCFRDLGYDSKVFAKFLTVLTVEDKT